jgi:hypothetical protein
MTTWADPSALREEFGVPGEGNAGVHEHAFLDRGGHQRENAPVAQASAARCNSASTLWALAGSGSPA